MFRFLHTSDWHLDKPFGQADPDLRGVLRDARRAAVGRIAAAARAAGAAHVLVAGDVWDNPAPRPDMLRQPLDRMAAEGDLTWVLLPGNHDPERPGGLWERLSGEAPANVIPIREAAPIELAHGIWLLPAPCVSRDAGLDATAWMDAAATPPGALRLGLAHGSIRRFGDDRADSAAIDPARPERAGLAYLALGDWHGMQAIGPRLWYSGTPEPDSFTLPDAPPQGRCLAVSLAGAEAPAEVVPVTTGRHAWAERRLELLPGAAPAGLLRACLPEETDPALTLLRLRLTGRAGLSDRAAWEAAVAALAPSLAQCTADFTGLELALEAGDLDRIDRDGALRAAAEALRAQARDEAMAPEDRRSAQEALNLLYSWCAAEEAGA